MPVLRSTLPAAQLSSARQSASYPLVPFSTRIAHATLQWQGTQHPLVRNNAPICPVGDDECPLFS